LKAPPTVDRCGQTTPTVEIPMTDKSPSADHALQKRTLLADIGGKWGKFTGREPTSRAAKI